MATEYKNRRKIKWKPGWKMNGRLLVARFAGGSISIRLTTSQLHAVAGSVSMWLLP
ncbi:MAG: hypothetical protein M0R06_16785 [Sphaerochaeta sp.]|jgi:hypothetical protein|nr:hypothetical protein [Sphaerochaeta sp.]